MQDDKEYFEESDRKLQIRQNVFLRGFLINLVFVFICWLLSFWNVFMRLGSNLIQIPIDKLDIYYINWLVVWGIAGIVMFLVPGLATYWARFAMKKMFH